MAGGYSTDVLVHAFAGTAREVGISTDLTRPFFASMRADLDTSEHDAASLAAYVYGSAEVVGLMCLRVFLHDLPPAERRRRYAELAPGARALGAAFQKVNFLRDLADDDGVLGRNYLGIDPAHVGEAQKDAVLADIEADLAVARTALRELPPGAAPRGRGGLRPVRRADRADPGDPGRRAGDDPGPGARPGQGADRGHRRAAGVGGRAMRAVVIGGRGRRAGLRRAAGPRGSRGDGARGPRRGRRPGVGLAERRVPVRHRPVVVPDARGVRPLLRPDGDVDGRGAGPGAARPGLPGVLRAVRPAGRADRGRRGDRAVRVGRARGRARAGAATWTRRRTRTRWRSGTSCTPRSRRCCRSRTARCCAGRRGWRAC